MIDKNNVVKPDLVLNSNDKIYLAVASKNTIALYFVYALVAKRMGKGNTYSMIPETEIATFQDGKQAYLYANSLREMSAYQEKQMPKLFESYKSMNAAEIEKFKQNTK